jgi:hypothetical protein
MSDTTDTAAAAGTLATECAGAAALDLRIAALEHQAAQLAELLPLLPLLPALRAWIALPTVQRALRAVQ